MSSPAIIAKWWNSIFESYYRSGKIVAPLPKGQPFLVMRAEHGQTGEQLEAIHDKVANHSPESDQEEKVLLDSLHSHNMKEERVLIRPSTGSCRRKNEPSCFEAGGDSTGALRRLLRRPS
jgi:hypothetical protein